MRFVSFEVKLFLLPKMPHNLFTAREKESRLVSKVWFSVGVAGTETKKKKPSSLSVLSFTSAKCARIMIGSYSPLFSLIQSLTLTFAQVRMRFLIKTNENIRSAIRNGNKMPIRISHSMLRLRFGSVGRVVIPLFRCFCRWASHSEWLIRKAILILRLKFYGIDDEFVDYFTSHRWICKFFFGVPLRITVIHSTAAFVEVHRRW